MQAPEPEPSAPGARRRDESSPSGAAPRPLDDGRLEEDWVRHPLTVVLPPPCFPRTHTRATRDRRSQARQTFPTERRPRG